MSMLRIQLEGVRVWEGLAHYRDEQNTKVCTVSCVCSTVQLCKTNVCTVSGVLNTVHLFMMPTFGSHDAKMMLTKRPKQ